MRERERTPGGGGRMDARLDLRRLEGRGGRELGKVVGRDGVLFLEKKEEKETYAGFRVRSLQFTVFYDVGVFRVLYTCQRHIHIGRSSFTSFGFPSTSPRKWGNRRMNKGI